MRVREEAKKTIEGIKIDIQNCSASFVKSGLLIASKMESSPLANDLPSALNSSDMTRSSKIPSCLRARTVTVVS